MSLLIVCPVSSEVIPTGLGVIWLWRPEGLAWKVTSAPSGSIIFVLCLCWIVSNSRFRFWFYWLRCCISSHCSTLACSSWQELSGGTNLLAVVPFTVSVLSSGFFQSCSSGSFRSFHRSYTSWNLSWSIVNVLTWDKLQSLKWWIFSSHYPVFWFLRFSFSISVAFPTL